MTGRYLSDTNVLSELMPEHPATAVGDWFILNTHAAMYISTVTQAEFLIGIALLPAGKRRTALAVAAEQMFEQGFAVNYLEFDAAAAKNHAGHPHQLIAQFPKGAMRRYWFGEVKTNGLLLFKYIALYTIRKNSMKSMRFVKSYGVDS